MLSETLPALNGTTPYPVFTPTGLAPELRNLTIEQWGALIVYLSQIYQGSKFALGDAINRCEDEHGERYSQFTQDTGLSADRLSNVAYTARWITEPMREGLTFGVAEVVTPLARRDPELAAEVIAEVVRERLGVEETKTLLDDRGLRPKAVEKPLSTIETYTLPFLREKAASSWPNKRATRNNGAKYLDAFLESL